MIRLTRTIRQVGSGVCILIAGGNSLGSASARNLMRPIAATKWKLLWRGTRSGRVRGRGRRGHDKAWPSRSLENISAKRRTSYAVSDQGCASWTIQPRRHLRISSQVSANAQAKLFRGIANGFIVPFQVQNETCPTNWQRRFTGWKGGLGCRHVCWFRLATLTAMRRASSLGTCFPSGFSKRFEGSATGAWQKIRELLW